MGWRPSARGLAVVGDGVAAIGAGASGHRRWGGGHRRGEAWGLVVVRHGVAAVSAGRRGGRRPSVTRWQPSVRGGAGWREVCGGLLGAEGAAVVES
ncbi:hypothetical protein GUJ93_ZPchr0012g18907 [Zizania palustris]|uniref:Uncharacterized protein n=1 Tax=Zizania palustris TaxID=103762 RepID=A0A8J5WUV7_ZIZPA|nr:hypothetical protein GUJ93_ZPchr0012g18907 [Zizania palustris]